MPFLPITMSMSRAYSFALLLFMLVYGLSVTGCNDAQSKGNGDDEDEPAIVIPVEVGEVATGNIAAYFTGTATLEAEEEAVVISKAGGIVQRIFVEEGQYVRRGQVLAQLDSEQATLEVAQLEANLRRLENHFNRNKELFDKQLISEESFDQIKFDYEAQKAGLDLRKLQVGYAQITAPISGVISERMIKVGNLVPPNQGAFRVTDFNPLHALVFVPERELSKLRVGQRTMLMVDALPEESFEGRIRRISPIIDAGTGTFKVTVEVKNSKQTLKPGMLARVNITYDVHENALLIPKEAVVQEDAESTVFTVRGDTVYRKVVQTGYTDAGAVEILAGLDLGERVVTTGQSSLKDSTRVEVIE